MAPVPFVTTIARDPADAVLLLIDKADPVVAPLMEIRTIVEAAVIAEFVSVNVRSAPAAIETLVNVARPDLPLTTTGEAAAPESDGDVNNRPVPDVDATKFPFVAVILPSVAVMVVPAANDVVVVNDPGAVMADGSDTVAVPATVLTVIWFAVPETATTSPDPLENSDQDPPPAYT